MAKTTRKKATVTTAFGSPLGEAVEFTYDYQELQKGDEIPPKEVLDEEDIRIAVNAKRNAAARSKAQSDAFKAANISAPTLEDADFRLKQMVKVLIAAGRSEADAEQVAKSALGM